VKETLNFVAQPRCLYQGHLVIHYCRLQLLLLV
jgi:hypothetical protein